MKRRLLISTLILTFLFAFSLTGHASDFLLGAKLGFGMSYVNIMSPDLIADGTDENTVRLANSFGADGYYYFIKNFGLHFNLGYNLIQGKMKDLIKIDYNSWRFYTFNIDIGPSIQFSGVFIDLDFSFNFKISYWFRNTSSGWMNVSEINSNSSENTFVFALGITAGYRFDFGKIKMPLSVSFKYYLTTFSDRIAGFPDSKIIAWSLLFNLGILFNL